MLTVVWRCTECDWVGSTEQLELTKEGHRVCPMCHHREGLE